MSDHQINLALRTAAGHARAAHDALHDAEATYEMKMRSAGASLWEAWKLACESQPEFKGRKLDDKALVRIYESTKARPWWDRHLSTVKFAGKPCTREWAKRTLQWHTDPDAARARRAKDAAVSAARHRKVKEMTAKAAASAASRGSQRPQAGGSPTTDEMRQVGKAAALGEGYSYGAPPSNASADMLNQLARVCRATRNVPEDQLAEAEAILRLAAEGLEAL